MLNNTEMDMLESLVDKYTLTDVLDALVNIAYNKYDHILVNWQDKITAHNWQTTGDRIAKLVSKINL